jgi:hypothetical protein
MSVRIYLRTPAALAWTLLAVVAVGAVVALGWQLAFVLAASPLLAGTAFSGELAAVLLLAFVTLSVAAAAAAVWLPCSAAIAHTVGRRSRRGTAAAGGSASVLRSRAEPLYRWAKTRLATVPKAERILTEDDVAPTELLVGCDAFVVPAIVLDAPTLPTAVERANRIVPQPGRRRVQLTGIAATTALALSGGFLGSWIGPITVLPAPTPLVFAAAGALVGIVVTAAIDTAWRASVYASADPDDGFLR